ncbi:MAG: DUF1178 family protein [Limnobacter sp.]|nr:DUF1178 family protein [Limnobacter sp.]
MATIIYDLECEYSHRFEGWFRSIDNYEEQRASGLLQCPECGTTSVRKVPSRLNIGSKNPDLTSSGFEVPQTEGPPAHSGNAPPIQLDKVDVATAFVMAKQAVQALIRHSEDVGSQFAEEARKIHYQEAPLRAIRGQASAEEFEELRDEGIDIIALPNLPLDEELN